MNLILFLLSLVENPQEAGVEEVSTSMFTELGIEPYEGPILEETQNESPSINLPVQA